MWIRWTVAALAAGWLAVVVLVAQSTDPSVAQLSIVEKAFDKGGGYAILLLVGFFYRRDWQRLADTKDQQLTILTKLVAENTAAQTQTAAALSQNTVVVHQAKRVLETLIPLRRDGDRFAADT